MSLDATKATLLVFLELTTAQIQVAMRYLPLSTMLVYGGTAPEKVWPYLASIGETVNQCSAHLFLVGCHKVPSWALFFFQLELYF